MNSFSQAFPARQRRALALAASGAVLIAAALFEPAQAATENRSVANFDEVVLAVPGEVSIEQGSRETLTLEAEPAVLRQITTEVRGRRLLIGVAPGGIRTQQPIRMKLGVRALRALESRAPGAISIGWLSSDSLALVLAGAGSIHLDRLENARGLEVRIDGNGDVAIGGGKVIAQQLVISGVGSYAAPQLASERAQVVIDGNGDVQLAASHALSVRIGGVGNVRYRGDPAVKQSIHGIGSVEKD